MSDADSDQFGGEHMAVPAPPPADEPVEDDTNTASEDEAPPW